MTDSFSWLTNYLTPERMISLVRALIILSVGIIVSRLVAASVGKIVERRSSKQQSIIFRKMALYLMLTLVLVSALRELGFQLGVLLGAAGVLTVAVGFASQTSASNIISGLFLLADRPFQIGDVIQIGQTTGVVHSIELLSVKLQTFQNHLVRIPNEELIKSQVINFTYWPIRRIDIEIGVAYKEDIGKVRSLLMEVADRNPLCLEEPGPLFIFAGYGDSSINLQFCIWVKKENYLDAMNSTKQQIKEIFDRNGIEIPFPQVSVSTSSVTDPFPIAFSRSGKTA
ncbi:mechanosensitive ion channel family protein [bacterium]|nr:mechanosensitive ion channel family protein [bacterium]